MTANVGTLAPKSGRCCGNPRKYTKKRELMAGKMIPERRMLNPDDTLVEQGAPGDELYLVLDGILGVVIDGEEVAEIGPGALLGELALLEGGKRTATLWATTPVRAVVVPPDAIDQSKLEELAAGRRADG